MLIIDVSKTRSTSQRLELDGDGIDYIIQLDWSTRYQRFFMEIYDSERNLLTAGIKLVPGSPINTGSKDSNGPQGLFIVSGTGELTRESFDNGGYRLYYFPRSGFTTFPLISDYLIITDFQEYVEENAPEPPNLFDGFFVTTAQTGEPISPSVTTVDTAQVSWLWGDGGVTSGDDSPTHSYTDDADSHEVDSYTVAAEDFRTIDLSNCHVSDVTLDALYNLTSVDVSNNDLNAIKVTNLGELTDLDFSDNLVDSFQLEGLEKLVTCYAQNNSLTEISARSVYALKILNLAGNDIEVIDPTQATSLEELYISNNVLSSGEIDVTPLTLLTTFEASNCGLTALDVSQNPLDRLIASFNNLTSFDISNNTLLTYVDSSNNLLDSSVVDQSIVQLDNNGLSDGFYDYSNNADPTSNVYSNYASLISKNWTLIGAVPDSVYLLYNSLAADFDGTGTNYLSSDGAAFGISDEISFGSWVNMDEYVAPTTHPVNSFNPDGSTQSARKTGYSMTGKFTNFSWSCWVKLQDTGNGQTVFRVSSSVGGVSDIALMYDWSALDPSLADKITIGWHSGTTTWEYISTSNFTVGQWIHIVVGKSGANWKLYINKILELDYTATTTPTELSNCILATEHNSLVEKLASPCSQYYMSNQQLDQTDVDNLYGSGTPPCLEDLATVTKNKMTNHWKLGTFNGSTEADAMLDQIGSDDFSNIGSTPFNGTGLSVECESESTATATVQGIVQKGEINTEGYTMSRRIENGENLIDFNLVTGSTTSGTSPVDSLTLLNDADYVTATKSTAISDATSMTVAFSLYLVPKAQSSRTINRIFSLNYNAPSGRTTGMYSSDGIGEAVTITCGIFPTPGSTSGSLSFQSDQFLRGEWYRILVRYIDGGLATCWVNGVESVGNSTITNGIGNSDLYDIGLGVLTSTSLTTNMEGYLNNQRMWNRDLSNSEIAEDYNGDPTEYVSYDKLVSDGSSLVSGLIFDAPLTDATLEENTNNSTLTASGSPTYTDKGMTEDGETTSLVSTTISSTDLMTGQWKFLAATYNNVEGLMRLYVDGVNVATSANIAANMNVSANDLLVGNLNTLDGLFQGCMMFPFVANKKFIDSQITTMYNSGNPIRYEDLETDSDVTTDMVGHWNLADWNNGAHTGDELLNNVAPIVSGGAFAVNSANFDGSNQSIESNLSTSVNLTSDFTIKSSFIVDSFSGGSWACPLAIDNGSNIWVEIRVNQSPQEIRCNVYTGTTDNATVLTPLTLGAVNHVVVTHTGFNKTLELWVNGVSIGIGTHTVASTNLNRLVTGRTPIGRPSGVNYMNGTVSFPKVWTRKLTDNECIAQTSVPICYDDEESSILVDNVFAPDLCNWDNNTGQELLDRSPENNTLVNQNSTPFTGTGLSVDCGTTITNDLVDNGSIPFDCTGVDVASNEDPYTPPPSTLINSSHFRLHAVDVNNPPTSQITYNTSLDITSAVNSAGSFYLLTTVPKADLEGNHIYLDLELTADYTGENIRRNVLLLEGTVEGDDPMFVNGQHITPAFTVSTGGTNSQFNERVVYDNPVPDITSVTDPNMTICVELHDSWSLLNIDWSIHSLQVRTPTGDIVKDVVLSNPIYKTGETLPSKSGVITDEAVVPYTPPNVTLTDALNGVTGPFLRTYDVHNALGDYVRTIHYGPTASRDNNPHEGWSISGSYLSNPPNISYWAPYSAKYYLSLNADLQFSSFINSTDGLAGMNFNGSTVIPSVYF